jgi:hypothetical protein
VTEPFAKRHGAGRFDRRSAGLPLETRHGAEQRDVGEERRERSSQNAELLAAIGIARG